MDTVISPPLPASTAKGWGVQKEALPLLGQHLSSTQGDKNPEANSACGWQHEGRSGSSGYRHPRGSSVARWADLTPCSLLSSGSWGRELVLAGLGSEGQEASRLGPWYQSPSNSRTVGVLGVGGPKSQLRSPHFPGVGVVSTGEDQVKDGHPAVGPLEVPALWWELVSVWEYDD